MKDLKILITIILAFTLPMLTSWLLDWWWIQESWPRYSLIILLMISEFVIAVLLLLQLLKK